MKRNVMQLLIEWKNSEDRKPLILEGARQVGKTWIMKEFGETQFEDYVYFNFDKEIELKEIFENNKDAHRIIEKLSLISNKLINPNSTLIILDEIQECSEALNSLKYFKEDARDYYVISAGSLLGTYLAKPHSYPVGQVNIIKMYPLTFDEFLEATDETLLKIYKQISPEEFTLNVIEEIFCTKFKDAYNKYLIIGGMPECVYSWIKYHDISKVDKIQKDLIEIYKNDITKHNGKINTGRILMVFDNIAPQLAKENKKFIYGRIQKGARAKEFEEAIQWLSSSGLINIVNNVSKNEYPLKTYDDLSAFKIYFFDTGLLKQMSGIENDSIILDKDFSFKGALTENYVLQQLIDQFIVSPRYFTFDRYETDFIIQKSEKIIPIEVKAGNSISSSSLSNYRKKFNPEQSIRYSMLNFNKDTDLINIPLYFARLTKKLL